MNFVYAEHENRPGRGPFRALRRREAEVQSTDEAIAAARPKAGFGSLRFLRSGWSGKCRDGGQGWIAGFHQKTAEIRGFQTDVAGICVAVEWITGKELLRVAQSG